MAFTLNIVLVSKKTTRFNKIIVLFLIGKGFTKPTLKNFIKHTNKFMKLM